MEYSQVIVYERFGEGLIRKAQPYIFYRLALGDTLLLTGKMIDITNVRSSASQFAAGHGIRLRVTKLAPDRVRVTREPLLLPVEYRRKGRSVGAEGAKIDALAVGDRVVFPWRTNEAGTRVEQGGLWQMVKRGMSRGQREGREFYTGYDQRGVEVHRLK